MCVSELFAFCSHCERSLAISISSYRKVYALVMHSYEPHRSAPHLPHHGVVPIGADEAAKARCGESMIRLVSDAWIGLSSSSVPVAN
jgi:hypothetical protein